MGADQSTPTTPNIPLAINTTCSLDADAKQCSSELICSKLSGACKIPTGTNIYGMGYTTSYSEPYPNSVPSDICDNGMLTVNSATEYICSMTNVDNKFKYGLKNIDPMTNVDSKFNYSKKNLDKNINIPPNTKVNKPF
jgi:hypothetical protein